MRPEPQHKLTSEERESIIEIVNRPEYASLPPHQIVPRLADEGVYVASESSFYRVMKNHGQLNRRGREKVHERRAPTTHLATAPNQVWCWDIVRHEALFDRMAVRDRHDPAVAAAGCKLGTVQLGKRRCGWEQSRQRWDATAPSDAAGPASDRGRHNESEPVA